ncbi:MAG: DNA mismatch repair protein MutS, partial [Paludibacteraceae bacterium]|nr:DNA mismatch repair protein MutS [Paludibacteraceae bacterium]
MAKAKDIETPMMKQFNDIKAKYPDALLLFRCGDFYETYCEDAVYAAQVLGITLTKRSNGGASDAEMAGFPFHALDTYLPKLVRAGRRVAICDQLEDPKLTKKLVKRGVTEVVTPGVSYSDATLNGKENNFVACLNFDKSVIGVSFLDISTGEFLVAEGTPDYVNKLLTNFSPKEVLYERSFRQRFKELFAQKIFTYELEDCMMNPQSARDRLHKQFGTRSLKGFGVERLERGIVAAGAILHYLDITQHLQTGHISSLQRIEEDQYVWLDHFTVRNLELYNSDYKESATLFSVLNRTSSPMGARMLKRWIAFPLKNVAPINGRLDVVEHFFKNPETRAQLSEHVSTVGDLERLVSKAVVGRIGPRELLQLQYALTALEPIQALCADSGDDQLGQMASRIDPCVTLRDRIRHDISPSAPAMLSKGNVIRAGVNEELDDLRQLSTNSKEALMAIQQREAEQTGIQSLKIGYNNVFGYYMEVRNTYKDRVPESWIRKQTLVNAERYITPELKDYEEKILGAEDRMAVIEAQIYAALLADLTEFVTAIQRDATIVAELDCLLSFTRVSIDNRYCRPVVDDSLELDIHEGRHPVIERQLPAGEHYVANDVYLNNDSQQIIIITGPNMSGKSALLRQTALIVLMAQIGCFVPAESAHIGVVDKIFTRVGASDNIAAGESTFMVEM